jgi:16S rRNA C1402 N4-methylase RsmH
VTLQNKNKNKNKSKQRCTKTKTKIKKQHEPVLLDEVLQYLDPEAGDRYLDLTAGYGGHAGAVLERTGSLTHATLVDRDTNAIKELRNYLAHKT